MEAGSLKQCIRLFLYIKIWHLADILLLILLIRFLGQISDIGSYPLIQTKIYAGCLHFRALIIHQSLTLILKSSKNLYTARQLELFLVALDMEPCKMFLYILTKQFLASLGS